MANIKILWTPKQQQIAELLQKGTANKDVAAQLGVAKSLVSKVAKAMKNGSIPPLGKHEPQTVIGQHSPVALPPENQLPLESATAPQSWSATPPGQAQQTQTPQPSAAQQSFSANEVATQMKLMSLPVTVPMTPIMLNARAYLTMKKGWRKDMPWENFFDTIIYRYFDACGVRIAPWYEEELLDLEKDEQTSTGNAKVLPKPAGGNGVGDTVAVEFNKEEMKLALMVARHLKQMAETKGGTDGS